MRSSKKGHSKMQRRIETPLRNHLLSWFCVHHFFTYLQFCNLILYAPKMLGAALPPLTKKKKWIVSYTVGGTAPTEKKEGMTATYGPRDQCQNIQSDITLNPTRLFQVIATAAPCSKPFDSATRHCNCFVLSPSRKTHIHLACSPALQA